MAAWGAPAPRRTRHTAGPPSSRLSARRHRPLTSCTPLLESSASPPFWLSPPVRAPEPGSGYSCPAGRTRGRGKCFRGSRPGVGVCKLASVPAGAAAATGLALCARAWRRRRSAGETAGGRARQFQVSETDVNFIERIQLENQDRHVLFLQTIGRSQAESRNS